MGITRKQIAFDIDTNVAKEMFGDNYTKVYDDMEHFFKNKNFQHIQRSVYISRKPMTNLDILHCMKDLKKQYPYMDKCVRKITLSSASNQKLNQIFSYDGTAGQYKKFTLPLPSKWLKRTITVAEATELLNNGIPFNAKKVDSNVLIVYEKSQKSQIDTVLDNFKQKNSQQQNNKPKMKR